MGLVVRQIISAAPGMYHVVDDVATRGRVATLVVSWALIVDTDLNITAQVGLTLDDVNFMFTQTELSNILARPGTYTSNVQNIGTIVR